jgi:hypothetical protein
MDAVATDVWQVSGPGLRMPGGAVMPVSSTVIRLPDRSLLVYSPIAFTDADAAAIEAAGEVAHVVAPSQFHHLFAVAAAARWPRATVRVAPGVADKQPALAAARELAAPGGSGAPAAAASRRAARGASCARTARPRGRRSRGSSRGRSRGSRRAMASRWSSTRRGSRSG